MDGATFLKRFSFCVFLSLQLTACLEEEGEKKSTNSSSSSPSSGGGGGGGSTTPASILDGATANFKFAVPLQDQQKRSLVGLKAHQAHLFSRCSWRRFLQ